MDQPGAVLTRNKRPSCLYVHIGSGNGLGLIGQTAVAQIYSAVPL